MLHRMRKVQRPDQVLRTLHLLSDHGISSLSTFIVGFPGETPETVQRTIDLLNAYPDYGSGVHWFDCWVHVVYPLTFVDQERDQWKLRGYLLDWEHETMNVEQAFRECQRLYREVRGGAYLGPYQFEDLSPFIQKGEHTRMRRFLKLRQWIGCMDSLGLSSLHGISREEALWEIEQIVSRVSSGRSALAQ